MVCWCSVLVVSAVRWWWLCVLLVLCWRCWVQLLPRCSPRDWLVIPWVVVVVVTCVSVPGEKHGERPAYHILLLGLVLPG